MNNLKTLALLVTKSKIQNTVLFYCSRKKKATDWAQKVKQEKKTEDSNNKN